MSDDELIGKQFGEYRLDSMLGQGGMARIYRATDVRLKRQAVIKVIDPPSHNDPDYLKRFEREAQIIGKLDHPNIVRLYRYDEQDGWFYMAMQYIEGEDLEALLGRHRQANTLIEPTQAVRIVREICSALDYAHKKGVIHRDVKPANILLDDKGQAFLGDFGLALITDIGTRGEIFGSAHYIAPEQAVSSAKAVAQSDLYAMGVILYEMFTGDVPFQAEKALDIAFLHMTEPPAPPSQAHPEIGPALEAVILKSLAKKPEERYQTGATLADALDAALGASGLLATIPTPPQQDIPEGALPPIPAAVAAPVAPNLPNMDEAPLPPIPAAVAAPAPPAPAEKDAGTPPGPTQKNKRPLLYLGLAAGLGLLVLLGLVCLGTLLWPSIMNRPDPGATDDTQIAATPGATLPPIPGATATATGLSASQASPTSSETPIPPTKTPLTYALRIVHTGDSILVINQSGADFPLALLRLSNENGAVDGGEWGLNKLKVGQCVGVWKQDKKGEVKAKLPKDANCSLVGSVIGRDKDSWFGDAQLDISYDGKPAGVCDKKQKDCAISIVNP